MFLDRFTGDVPPYRLALEVEIGGVSEGTALIDADVNGTDYRATVHIALRGLPERDSEIVHVDSTGYLRDGDDDDWVVVPGYRSTPPLNPFLFLQPTDYADAGTDAARGGLRRLSSNAWVEQDATLGLVEGGVRDVVFDVWVDEAGTPVNAELRFELAGADAQGQQVQLSYTARYAFSDVGADIAIEPPVAAPTS